MRRNLICYCLFVLTLMAVLPAGAEQSQRQYTPEHPLIYEGAQDLWPYSFLSDNGTPEGYNIDLIKLVLGKLNIPYIIKMKPRLAAFADLKSGASDLMIGLTAGFHQEYGHYGESTVTLFTQSILSPKRKPTLVRNFQDLAHHKVYVNDSSLCHHLMRDYGWDGNAIPVKNPAETIKQMSTHEEGEMVWNTLTLKWLLRKYQISNLQVTPVNMPHGEYRFMSNDQHLLHLVDSVFIELSSSDKLLPLQNKWFYPDRKVEQTPAWVWSVGIGVALVLLLAIGYYVYYQLRTVRINRANTLQNQQLSLILETGDVRLWTYHVATRLFAWRNGKGQVAYTYDRESFARRYPTADADRLLHVVDQMAAAPLKKGEPDPEVTLNLKARDTEDGDAELRDIVVTISVLRRDSAGVPAELIGTKIDVTERRHQQQLSDERAMRYLAVFNTPLVGILFFNRDRILVNLNKRACEMFVCDADEIVRANVHLDYILDIDDLSPVDIDGFYATQFVDIDRMPAASRRVPAIRRTGVLCNEFRLMTVYDDDRQVLGYFAICRDVSHIRTSLMFQTEIALSVSEQQQLLERLETHIDNVIHGSDVRLVSYSPADHMLRVYRSANDPQYALTQTRCMTLVADSSKKAVMHMLDRMDSRTARSVQLDVLTTLRTPERRPLFLQFCLMPMYDKHDVVVEYLGLCRDLSECHDLQDAIAVQTAKVQEVEDTKNSFVKNTLGEIRRPLATLTADINRLDAGTPSDASAQVNKNILSTADRLLHFINNVLFLSRLEAHMVDIVPQPVNYAQIFGGQCVEGWELYHNSQTNYIVENPYEQLIVDVDAQNLGHVVRQLTANAAQHTSSGTVRARCEYIGHRLILSIDDTGEGMSPDAVKEQMQATAGAALTAKGLGLAICRELVSQMGGTIELSSEEHVGTTVYVTIPCQATAIKRQRNNEAAT